MNEKPLERLNYYNGQSLDAPAFKTEQDYHIRTRRWLNKSLYSAGIARGLEVRPVPGSRTVTVSPGLALDSEGREIILLEQTPVEVCSYAGTSTSTVEGNYLVIEYAEETIAYERGGCAVRAAGTSASKSTAPWGGPARIQAQVKFSWVPFVPQPGSNQIVLARVELDSNCSAVQQIDAGARRYVGAGSAAMVKQYALEGERDVALIPKESFPTLPAPAPQPTDVDVVGRIYFHIRGRQPSAVTLYIRAEPFSPLHYTELGLHTHTATLTGSLGEHHITQTDLNHVHSLDDAITKVITDIEKEDDTFDDGVNTFGPHQHWLSGRTGNTGSATIGNFRGIGAVNTNGAIQVVGNEIGPDDFRLDVKWGRHRHRLIADPPGPVETPGPTKFTEIVLSHSLNAAGSTILPTGVADLARSGASLAFVSDLQVYVGGASNVVNRTDDIRRQLADAEPTDWIDGAGVPRLLGDGSGNHVLALNGTGSIRLDFLPGMTFPEGEYCIELRVEAKTEAGQRVANGGKILYNLYVE